MSFDITCENCGAPSSPSVGICNFCKASFVSGKIKNPTLSRLQTAFEKGEMESAMRLAHSIEGEKNKSKLSESADFALLYAKILLECEGPTSKIKLLLLSASHSESHQSVANDYLDIVEAKVYFTMENNALGEQLLKNVLSRVPSNPHAQFVYGAHQFWISKNSASALSHLSKTVNLRPNFLRAWACLGALYQSMGQSNQAIFAFRRCLKLETNKLMYDFFEERLKELETKEAA